MGRIFRACGSKDECHYNSSGDQSEINSFTRRHTFVFLGSLQIGGWSQVQIAASFRHWAAVSVPVNSCVPDVCVYARGNEGMVLNRIPYLQTFILFSHGLGSRIVAMAHPLTCDLLTPRTDLYDQFLHFILVRSDRALCGYTGMYFPGGSPAGSLVPRVTT